jgi:hypothetical protein
MPDGVKTPYFMAANATEQSKDTVDTRAFWEAIEPFCNLTQLTPI